MSDKLKAYKTSCPDDDHMMDVVFAENANQARKCGNGEMCDCGYINIRAVRVPQFDHLSPGPVPIEVLLQAGWMYQCQTCESHVYSDQPDRVIVGDRCFCSPACVQGFKEQIRKYGWTIEGFEDVTPPRPALA